MAMVNKPGLMELNTLVNGEKTEHMVKADLFMLMEIFTTASGLMIKLMVSEHTNM